MRPATKCAAFSSFSMIGISLAALLALAHIPAYEVIEPPAPTGCDEPDLAPPLVDLTKPRPDYIADYGVLPEHSIVKKPEVFANKVVVLSSPTCIHCQPMKVVVATLNANGYKAEYINEKDYKGKPTPAELIKNGFPGLPILMYFKDSKLVATTMGRRSYNQVTAMLDKGDQLAPIDKGK